MNTNHISLNYSAVSRYSNRSAEMQYSPIRKLTPYAKAARENGTHVFQLNIGQPDIPTPKSFFSFDQSSIETVAYGPSDGLPAYKQALSNFYKRHAILLEPDQLIVTTAGSEGILFTLLAVCDYGDELIIPEPFYTNYNAFCTMAGVKPVAITTSIQSNFSLPHISQFEAKLSPKTKAVLICNPNNPTGAVYSKEALNALAEFCRKNNLVLIADEVYREFVFKQDPCSIMQLPGVGDHLVMIDSLSKRYSICGARLGSIATRNTELLKQLLKFAQSRLCPPTMEQLYAITLLRTSDDDILAMREQYRIRNAVISKALEDAPIPITYSTPEGAFYTMASLPIKDAEEFAVFMLSEFSLDNATVFIAPAEGFYSTPGLGHNEIRIAAVLEPEALKQAMHILLKGLDTFMKTR